MRNDVQTGMSSERDVSVIASYDNDVGDPAADEVSRRFAERLVSGIRFGLDECEAPPLDTEQAHVGRSTLMPVATRTGISVTRDPIALSRIRISGNETRPSSMIATFSRSTIAANRSCAFSAALTGYSVVPELIAIADIGLLSLEPYTHGSI